MRILFFVATAFCLTSATTLSASAQSLPGYAVSDHVSPALNFKKELSPFIENLSEVAVKPTASYKTIATELCTKVQFKFAQLLDKNVELLTNVTLFNFLDQWWHTRYRFGGTSKKGIDCSAFTGLLLKEVYDIDVPRTARMQYGASEKLDKEDLMEGDLVFFNTRGGVSHVGFYLGGGYFAHASSSQGVTIDNLDEGYYKQRFISGGRPIIKDVNENIEQAG